MEGLHKPIIGLFGMVVAGQQPDLERARRGQICKCSDGLYINREITRTSEAANILCKFLSGEGCGAKDQQRIS